MFGGHVKNVDRSVSPAFRWLMQRPIMGHVAVRSLACPDQSTACNTTQKVDIAKIFKPHATPENAIDKLESRPLPHAVIAAP